MQPRKDDRKHKEVGERNTVKLNGATVLGKILQDQMAKRVIYLFTYFCNTKCSKIIYGFGINTEAVEGFFSYPPLLPLPLSSLLALVR
jgi:hypothetical protein